MRIILIILMFASYAFAQAPYMSSLGSITTDPVTSFTFKDANTVFAAFNGGVAKSVDAGESWTQIFAVAPSDPTVHSVFFTAPDSILIARNNGTLQLINEAGVVLRFYVAGSARPTVGITRSPATNTIIFARRSLPILMTWIYRSTNNARSFTSAVVPGLFESIAFAPDGKLYARDSYLIYRSLDEGVTWSIVATAPSALIGDIVFEADGRFLCAIDQGLFTSYSGDPGTFSLVQPFPSGVHLTALVAGPGNTLFGALNTGGWKYSMDRGISWSTMPGDGNPIGSELALSPSGHLFGGTSTGVVYRSNTSAQISLYGVIWARMADSLRTVSSDKLWAMLPDNSGGIYIGTWGGKVFYTNNQGTSWLNITANLRVGFVWSLTIDNDYLYAATEFGVFRSPITSITWTQTALPFDTRSIVKADGVLFAATFGHGVFRSSDHGLNWSTMNNGLTTLITTALAVDSNDNLYVGSFGGGIQKSTNGGLSWTISNLQYRYVWSLAVDERNILYAGTYGSYVFRSLDLGATYEHAYNGMWDRYVIQLTAFGSQVVAGTWWNGVFTTFNGGENWSRVTLQSMSEVDAVRGNHDLDPGLARDLPIQSTDVSSSPATVIPSEYKLEQNFPNPFNPSTSIRFALPQAAHVKLTVYDLNGRLVTTLVNDNLTAGNHFVEFHAANLPSGVYFYRIQAGAFQATEKMLLTK